MGGKHLRLSERGSFLTRLKRAAEAYTYRLLLHFYLYTPSLIRVPLIGETLKKWFNWYAATQHGGKVVSREEAYQWIERARDITGSICYCRDTFRGCTNFLNSCLRLSDSDLFLRIDEGARRISKQEAKDIVDEGERRGLIHLVAWCGDKEIYAICNCCRCCCISYRIWKRHEIGCLEKGDMVASRRDGLCIGCGRCIEWCGFGAIKRSKDVVEFNQKRCFGCGICREACEVGAISLVKR